MKKRKLWQKIKAVGEWLIFWTVLSLLCGDRQTEAFVILGCVLILNFIILFVSRITLNYSIYLKKKKRIEIINARRELARSRQRYFNEKLTLEVLRGSRNACKNRKYN